MVSAIDQAAEMLEESLEQHRVAIARMLEDKVLHEQIVAVADACVAALQAGGKVLYAGNGGSAADAQHMAGELVSRFMYDRPGLPGIALTVDTSILTAIGNDYGYEKLFSRQVQAVGQTGDIFIGLTTSGNSPNIVEAVKMCNQMGLKTFCLTGPNPCALDSLKGECIKFPGQNTPRIQELHTLAGHIICEIVEAAIFPQEA